MGPKVLGHIHLMTLGILHSLRHIALRGGNLVGVA